jgi:hypothetical protein
MAAIANVIARSRAEGALMKQSHLFVWRELTSLCSQRQRFKNPNRPWLARAVGGLKGECTFIISGHFKRT